MPRASTPRAPRTQRASKPAPAVKPAPAADLRTSLLTDYDLYLFNEGTHVRVFQKLGAHVTEVNGTLGVYFAVWAPNADAVSLIGDFNSWNPDATPLQAKGSSGIW